MQRHWPTDRQKYLAAESNMDITSLILAPIWYFSPEKSTLKLFLKLTRSQFWHLPALRSRFKRLQKLRSMDHAVDHKLTHTNTEKRERYSQALTSKRKLKKAWGILKWRSLNEMMWWGKCPLAFGECFKEMACVWRVFYWSRLWKKVFSQGWLIFREFGCRWKQKPQYPDRSNSASRVKPQRIQFVKSQ